MGPIFLWRHLASDRGLVAGEVALDHGQLEAGQDRLAWLPLEQIGE